MKKKLSLKGLKVKSFVTSIEKGSEETLKGGAYNVNPGRWENKPLTDPHGTNYETCKLPDPVK